MSSDFPLEIADAARWERHTAPFVHFRVRDIFRPEIYARLTSAFSEILADSEPGRTGPYQMARTRTDYDARMMSVTDELAPRFAPLFELQWVRFLERLTGTPALDRISGGLHSSDPGARTGAIHADFCTAWFDESPANAGSLLLPRHQRVEYFTGRKLVPDAEPKQYVRATTLLFYLCNEGWKAGDGGETGLYGASRNSSRVSTELVPPVDNSMVIFNCSPHSYHRFVTNPGRRRNSIVMWLHQTEADAETRWGGGIHRRAAR
jgi:hypothetical protein